MVKSYKELEVWKLAVEQCLLVYRLTEKLPKEERFGLSFQMRRAAVSVPSNIAEGFARRHLKENLHFISIAQGSNVEIETHYIICEGLTFLKTDELLEARALNEHIGKKLTRYYQTLQR